MDKLIEEREAQMTIFRVEDDGKLIVKTARGTWGNAQQRATDEANKLARPVALYVTQVRADDVIFGKAAEQMFTVVPESWTIIDLADYDKKLKGS